MYLSGLASPAWPAGDDPGKGRRCRRRAASGGTSPCTFARRGRRYRARRLEPDQRVVAGIPRRPAPRPALAAPRSRRHRRVGRGPRGEGGRRSGPVELKTSKARHRKPRRIRDDERTSRPCPTGGASGGPAPDRLGGLEEEGRGPGPPVESTHDTIFARIEPSRAAKRNWKSVPEECGTFTSSA